MQVLQQRCKKMYDKGYRYLVVFCDGNTIFIKPEMEQYLPSNEILRYLTLLENGKLI